MDISVKNAQKIPIPKLEGTNAYLAGQARVRSQDQPLVVLKHLFRHHLSLDASTHLYMRVYPLESVQLSVRWSVGQSIHQSVTSFYLTTQIEQKWHRITGKVDVWMPNCK